jgi:hypothetical protein
MLLLLLLGSAVFAQNPGRPAGGEMTLRAFQNSYPEKINGIAFIDNDWTITVKGETFFWAGGRLLPGAEKDNVDSYSPYMFYRVPARPTPPETYPPEYIETLRSRGSREERMERKDNHRGFYAALYGGLERKDIEAQLERIDFLGYKVTVHRDIIGALKQAEAEIRRLGGSNAFIASLGSVESYSWRQIAGTQRMSYHSLGLAIDILPKNLGGKAIYWLWEQGRNKDWMLVPLEKRWSPPEPVIEIFERAGFIWGGKWPFFDNMHFEYRPELHELGRLMTAEAAAMGSGRVLHHIYPDMIRAHP